MLFDPIAAEADTGPALDFSRRAHLQEWMDGPCSYEELRDCLRDLAQVNRVTLAYRPTLQWLQAFTPAGTRPLHIVDVGSGGGDTLRRIERWAARKHLPVRLTGIDLNPLAVRAAQEFTPQESSIRWIEGNAYTFDHESDPVDIVISSLFTHHLPDAEIVCFLAWMERVALQGWFLSDLSRGPKAYALFRLLSKAAGWHRFVQHDGPVSIRRAFQAHDWTQYLAAAGLAHEPVRIAPFWPGRLTVGRSKQP